MRFCRCHAEATTNIAHVHVANCRGALLLLGSQGCSAPWYRHSAVGLPSYLSARLC